MFPPDVMHTIPKGIAELLRKILMLYAKTDVHIVDDRLANIPIARGVSRNLHYRPFATGISTMSVFTADDMIALLQQLPYVVGTGTGGAALLACLLDL